MLIELTSLAQAISVILACVAVTSGVDAWKREFIGKRRIELAEQVLAKFFEVKDAVAQIRNPWLNAEEGKTRRRGSSETQEESELLDRGYIAVERYQTKESVFREFNTLKYRAMASFGTGVEEIFTDTFKAVNSIFVSARMLGTHYWRRETFTGDRYQQNMEEIRRHEGVIWDIGADNDEVCSALSSVQIRLEQITAPVFKESMKSYSILTKPWGRSGSPSKDA